MKREIIKPIHFASDAKIIKRTGVKRLEFLELAFSGIYFPQTDDSYALHTVLLNNHYNPRASIKPKTRNKREIYEIYEISESRLNPKVQ